MDVLYQLSYPGGRATIASMNPRTTLRIALLAGALGIIGAGLIVALSGSAFGWAIAAFGVVDLVTIPIILRAVSGKRTPAGPAAADPEAPPAEPAETDPSYNPYARED